LHGDPFLAGLFFGPFILLDVLKLCKLLHAQNAKLEATLTQNSIRGTNPELERRVFACLRFGNGHEEVRAAIRACKYVRLGPAAWTTTPKGISGQSCTICPRCLTRGRLPKSSTWTQQANGCPKFEECPR